MAHDLQNVDLSHDSRDIRLVVDLVFLQNFDSDFLLSEEVVSFTHFAKRALSKCLAYNLN